MSESKAYVGNLPYTTTEDDLREVFGGEHQVTDVRLIKDRETGQSKGFAFVTFETPAGLEAAIGRNGEELNGRSLRINQAQERPRR